MHWKATGCSMETHEREHVEAPARAADRTMEAGQEAVREAQAQHALEAGLVVATALALRLGARGKRYGRHGEFGLPDRKVPRREEETDRHVVDDTGSVHHPAERHRPALANVEHAPLHVERLVPLAGEVNGEQARVNRFDARRHRRDGVGVSQEDPRR